MVAITALIMSPGMNANWKVSALVNGICVTICKPKAPEISIKKHQILK